MLILAAVGKFELKDCQGKNFTPRSMKARGLLLLLMVAPGRTRTRAWLQSKLWSDRAPEQAAGSLRNALTDLRRGLDLHSDLLHADRNSVTLDRELITFNYDFPNASSDAEISEPFEDLDVRDEEFEHIIRDLRAAFEKTSKPNRSSRSHRVIMIGRNVQGEPLASVSAQLFCEKLSCGLRQLGDFDIIDLHGSNGENCAIEPSNRGNDIVLNVNVLTAVIGKEAFIGCEIKLATSGRCLWSGNATTKAEVAALQASTKLNQLVRAAIEMLASSFVSDEAITSNENNAFALGQRAKSHLFQLDKKNLVISDTLFKKAFELKPCGQFLAWRAFLRNTAYHQHRSSIFLEGDLSSEQLLLEALRHSPENSIVQAISSQLEYVNQGSLRVPLAMARRAVETDPSDPLSCAFLSNALTANGRYEEGYRAATRAISLSSGTNYQFYFEHFACMAASSLGEYGTAISHARTGLKFRPDFISPRRYETVLAAKIGDQTGFDRSLAAMRHHETGFRPSMMLESDYPTPTLRRIPLSEAIH